MSDPCTAMLSLHPQHAQKLFEGDKRFELRRVRPRLSPGDEVLVYVTLPVGAVLGRFWVRRVIASRPEQLWSLVRGGCAVSRAAYREYFRSRRLAYAIEVGEFERFRNPVRRESILTSVPLFAAPQSYWYLRRTRAKDAGVLRVIRRVSSLDGLPAAPGARPEAMAR